jgi:hypothetical protein
MSRSFRGKLIRRNMSVSWRREQVRRFKLVRVILNRLWLKFRNKILTFVPFVLKLKSNIH